MAAAPDSDPTARPGGRRPALRAALLFGAPTLGLLVLVFLPVILGRETLILRDVLEVHLMLKAPQAEALRDGILPVLDPARSGGQPLLGNPNVVPFYPDNVLYLAGPVLWALNAHFWLHLLVAPVALCWMARAWGLSRSAAWAAGVCYGLSGFFLSQLNLYNLVAGAALVPALVAAALRAVEGRRGAAAAAGALWALVLVSGEPTTAVVGAALAGSAVLAYRPRAVLRPRVLGALLAAALLGTLVALPQVVELLRVLPATYRGTWGASESRLAVAAWRPIHALEWLVPVAFGRYDLQGAGGFWGAPLFAGKLPLFLSLYPGSLALALVAAAGRPRSARAGWGWGAVAAGMVLSAGGGTPLGRWLFQLPAAQGFRYPVKLWLAVAVGAALLCGIGWQRSFGRALGSDRDDGAAGAAGAEGEGERSLRRLAGPLAAIAGLLAAVLGFVLLAGARFEGLLLEVAPERLTPELAAAERARWIATLVLVAAVLLGLALALLLARRRPVLGAALLLAIHGAGQLHLLRGLRITDRADLYRSSPPPLAALAPGATVAHAGYLDLFGPSPPGLGPDNRLLWTLRQDFYSLIPPAGVLHGLRYELARTPEGLDSFLSRIAHAAVAAGPSDADRLRALSRWGVEYVIVEAPLRGVGEDLGELVGTWRGVTAPVSVYRLPGAAPEVLFAETELRVPHLNAAWRLFRSPGFDPGRQVVLPGAEGAPVPEVPVAAEPGDPGGPAGPAEGDLRVLRSGPESLEVAVDTPVPGFLVAQRSLLPVWRGSVDGAPVGLEPANLYRIGVPVPAGRHRVRLWVDRRPLRLAGAGSALGLAGLAALAFAGRRREAVEVEAPPEDV